MPEGRDPNRERTFFFSFSFLFLVFPQLPFGRARASKRCAGAPFL